MAKIIQFPISTPERLAHKVIRKRRKPDLEEFGQLNLFDKNKVIDLQEKRSYYEEALRLDEEGHADAATLYLKAIASNECVEDALCNLSVIMAAKGDKIAAIDYLTQCLEKSPRHFEAHYNLGNMYSELGNMSLAKSHYELAIHIAPEYPNAHYNLGLVLISQKEYKKAIGCINKFIQMSPDQHISTAKELVNTLNAIAQ
jgi:tetratricopeptide (TPR) repeat protein